MLGVNNVKLTKKSMNGLVHVEVPNNLDATVEKMKAISFIELSDHDKTQLECCLLFICGFSFDKIASRLNILPENVIQMLKNESLIDLLSDEYLLLFRKNQYRLNVSTNKREKIKNAVVTYINYDGRIMDTCKALGVVPATLYSYISNPDLENIIDDDSLFFQFIALRDNRTKHIPLEEISVKNNHEQMIKDLMLFSPNNVIERKYLILAKAILLQGYNSIDDIVKNTELSKSSVISYLDDFSRCENFFTPLILESLKREGNFMLNKVNCKTNLNNFSKYLISFYMNSRYTIDDMLSIFKISRIEIKYIMNEKAQELLSEEEFKLLKKHKNDISHIFRGCPCDCFVVKDPKMIKILKPDLVYVNEYQNRLLNLLNDILVVYDQLHYYDVNQSLDVKVQFLCSNFQELKKIINENSFMEISSFLEIEYLFISNSVKAKNQYVKSIVKSFLEYDMDLEITSKQLNINISALIRILQDSSIPIYYGAVLSKYIEAAINDYRMMYKKKNGTSIINYTKIKVLEGNKNKQV